MAGASPNCSICKTATGSNAARAGTTGDIAHACDEIFVLRDNYVIHPGGALDERSRAVLAEAKAGDAAAANLQAGPRGTLRINASISFGVHCPVPVLVSYLRTYPQVRVGLTLPDCIVDVVNEGYGAGIRIAPLANSGLIAQPLIPYRLEVRASHAYLTVHGTPIHPADLECHECLGFSYWAPPTDLDWVFKHMQGRDTARVKSRLINTGAGLRMAALEGLGIILQPLELVQDDLAAGQLVQLLTDYEASSRRIHLRCFPDRRPTPKLRSFVDHVISAFRQSCCATKK